MDLSNITVNGLPLTSVLEAQRKLSLSLQAKQERNDSEVKFHRPIVTRGIRNHSGSRSGRVRIIYSAGGDL